MTQRIGKVVWLTGLPGSGKSTIAQALEKALRDRGNHCFVLDGDKVRQGLNSDLGYSPEARQENIRRIGEVAKLFQMAEITVIVAFISPYRSDRERVRSIIPQGQFFEVFIDCPLDECEKRDPKGHYAKARKGEMKDFTGVSAPYEPPDNPEVHLKTSEQSVDQCVASIMNSIDAA